MAVQAARKASSRVPKLNAARCSTRPENGWIYSSPHGISRKVRKSRDPAVCFPSSSQRIRNVCAGRLFRAVPPSPEMENSGWVMR